jgi:hypothetical protein
MTVHEFELAQGLTSKPVKGMLTGKQAAIACCFKSVNLPQHLRLAAHTMIRCSHPCYRRPLWEQLRRLLAVHSSLPPACVAAVRSWHGASATTSPA